MGCSDRNYIYINRDLDPPAASSSSWLGRWWKKDTAAAPGPIKASLGEETSFVYDKDLKRWVNKKVCCFHRGSNVYHLNLFRVGR